MSSGMKYKVGDMVKVRQWDDMVVDFGRWNCRDRSILPRGSIVYFNQEMKKYCGEELEITKISFENLDYQCKGNNWTWEDWMFEDRYTPKPVEPSLEVILANAKLLLKRLGYTVVNEENLIRILTQPIKVKPMPIHQEDFVLGGPGLLTLPHPVCCTVSIYHPAVSTVKEEDSE